MKKPFFPVLIGFIALTVTPSLYGPPVRAANNNYTTEGDPLRSGGSEPGSRHSSKGAVLGPDLRLRAAEETQPLPPAVETNFEGFGFDDNSTENGGFLFIPPDPIGAAGTDRVIGVVNTMIEARNKTGTLLWRGSLEGFFSALGSSTLGTSTFDPKVIYDHYEDRFVVVTLEQTDTSDGDPSNESRILLAVSKTATPAGGTSGDWYFHAIDSKISISGTNHWGDYPGFEVDEEAVYITNNMFSFGSSIFGGVRLWIVDKGVAGGFYAGGPASVSVHNPYASGGIATTTMPCQVLGASGVGPGIGTFLVSYSGLSSGGDEFVQIVRVNDPIGTPTFTQEEVNIGDIEGPAFPSLPDAPQSGTSTLIEVNDRRALDCVWRDNALWLTTTILPNSGSDNNETTAHWFKFDTSSVVNSSSASGLITLADQGDIGGQDIATDTSTFFPSVAVNSNGDAAFGFAASAATIFPGAFVTGRQVGDTAGTVQASQTVHAGEDFYIRTFGGSRNRWGDYSGISLDPTDDSVFWVFNQFADTRGTVTSGEDGRWGTVWGSVTFGAGNPVPDIDVQPSSWNYGDLSVGSTSDKDFTVENTGTENLNATGTSLVGSDAGEFAIISGGGAFSLAPGGNRTVTVRFAPTSAGDKNATLRFTSDDPNENPKDVLLNGSAQVHDLSVLKITVPKTVTVKIPVTKPVKVKFQNLSDHDETIEASDLGDGVTTGLVRLSFSVEDDDGEGCQAATVALDTTKNAKIFKKGPKVLKRGKTLKVNYLVTYNCTDAQKANKRDPTPGDYSYVPTVHHDVLDGKADSNTANDTLNGPVQTNVVGKL